MKKKLFMALFVSIMLICVFAISISAAEFDKSEKVIVTLADGSTQECALYDDDGDELVWYTLDSVATLISIKTSNLVFSDEVSLKDISLADGTALQKSSDTTTNLIVVANLRGKTFTNLVHSSYKSTFDKSTVIQYVYLPSTIKSIACNQYQNCTNLKVLDFPSDAKFSLNDSNFAPGCTSLEEVNLTGLTGVTGSGHFSGCSSLSTIIGLEKSTTTRIGSSMFKGTAITEVRLPNTVTSLGVAAFSGCKSLKVAYLGAALSTLEINSNFQASDAFNGSAIEYLYMPNTVTAVPGYTFSNANSLRVIFFTGTKDEAVAMYNASTMTNNTPFQNLGKEESQFISYEAYKALPADDTGKYIVYGYNVCKAFYNDEHILSEEKAVIDFVGTDYFTAYNKCVACDRDGCDVSDVEEIAGAIFTSKGYSKNGDSIVFGIMVNNAELTKYNEYRKSQDANAIDIKYGVVVSKIQNDGNLIKADGTVQNDNVLCAEFSATSYSLLQIKIIGVASTDYETALHCCAFVADGKSTTYLYEENGAAAAGTAANAISYSDITTTT